MAKLPADELDRLKGVVICHLQAKGAMDKKRIATALGLCQIRRNSRFCVHPAVNTLLKQLEAERRIVVTPPSPIREQALYKVNPNYEQNHVS